MIRLKLELIPRTELLGTASKNKSKLRRAVSMWNGIE